MPLHIETPCIPSTELSARNGLEVWLKLEAVQPCGSFKLRGIGHACTHHRDRGAKRLVSSSGGNAGYAVAYAGRALGLPVTVVVPETTTERAKGLIHREGAEVQVHGASWQEANAHAQTLLGPEVAFIHPFDDPLLWAGHASLVDEMARQMPRPDVLICSVGGGGLLAGVAEGLQRQGWLDVGVLAVETAGAASFAAALHAGRPVALDAVTTCATSLAARQVTGQVLALDERLTIASHVLSDREAVQGVVDLLETHRLLTEPACGASVAGLAAVRQHFPQARRVAVIACGGVGTTIEQLQAWQAAPVDA